MNYYTSALNLLYDQAILTSYDGDIVEQETIYGELMDEAHDIANMLVSWGVSDDYAFWLASRRVVGSL